MSRGAFLAGMQQAFGPTGFAIREVRVPEKHEILNWGCVHPMKGQAILFGITKADFGSEESVYDLAQAQLERQIRGHSP